MDCVRQSSLVEMVRGVSGFIGPFSHTRGFFYLINIIFFSSENPPEVSLIIYIPVERLLA